jgi:signal peptidase II
LTTEKSTPPPAEDTHDPKVPAWKRGSWDLWPLSAGLFLFWLVADHATKLWAIRALKPEWHGYRVPPELEATRPIIDIIPGFLRFFYAENRGAAFSILYGQTFFLGIISLIATVGLIWFWRSLRPDEWWGRVATALILSGAVGNMIDRFGRGYVVDFIDAYVIWGTNSYHWPTFNIADSCICVGAVVLGWRLLMGKI